VDSSIQELLDRRADWTTLRSAVEAHNLVPAVGATEWVQTVSAVVAVTKSDLEWLNPDERRFVQHVVVWYVKKALTEFYPNAQVSQPDMEAALRDFTDWIALQEDSLVLDFVWDVLEYKPRL